LSRFHVLYDCIVAAGISTAVRHGISSFDACLSLYNGTALALVESWQD
jgi:hypothetical protein